jgi:hypothetical protein
VSCGWCFAAMVRSMYGQKNLQLLPAIVCWLMLERTTLAAVSPVVCWSCVLVWKSGTSPSADLWGPLPFFRRAEELYWHQYFF